MTYVNGRPYVAWTERSTAGNAELHVKQWNGSSWTLVGNGAINNDTTNGWTFHPRLVNDGTNVYISWEEQLSLGQPSRLYVAKWNGDSWSRLSSALNVDPINGSAAHSSIAMLNNDPVALWNEVQVGSLQQAYAKRWNGSSWTLLQGQRAAQTLRPRHNRSSNYRFHP
jgi:photosystem II stability/assembly factor-like uncharacterized protein